MPGGPERAAVNQVAAQEIPIPVVTKPAQLPSLPAKPVQLPSLPAKPAQPPALPAKPAQPPDLPAKLGPVTHFPPANGLDLKLILKTLRDGVQPEQRGWAASELARMEARGNGEVVEALIVAGQIDTSPTVRIQCLRALVKMNVDCPAYRQLLETLAGDPEPTLQEEARRALGKAKN